MLDSIEIACCRARIAAARANRSLIAIDMELVVVAPQLLALPAPTLQSSTGLARIAAWSVHAVLAGGRDAAALSALRMDDASPAALIARGTGIGLGMGEDNAHWLVADPVTLVAGRDDVAIASRVVDLDAAFAARVVESLNTHFAGDAMTFTAPRPGRWLLRLRDAPQLQLVPTDVAIGGSLYAHRPQGRDARTFERFGNEIQMLLFAATENDARERAGLGPFNGLWLWGNAGAVAGTGAGAVKDAGADAGAGAAAVPASRKRVDAFAAAGEPGDLARGAALATRGAVHGLDRGFDAVGRDGALTLVALPPLIDAGDFARCDATWFAPAADALACGALSHVTLIADGDGAHRWTARTPAWHARLRARFAPTRFGVST